MSVLIVTCAVVGIVVGSFLNVIIYRVPRGESIVRPASHCPKCGATVAPRDNIPIVSWLLLRGRCRRCGEAISSRYVVVEVLTGALFAGVAARIGSVAVLPADLVAVAALVALSAIDVELLRLPSRIVYPSLVIAGSLLIVAATFDSAWGQLVSAIVCAVVWFALFFVLNLVAPRALGFGDVRLAPLLGAVLGWFGWRYVVAGFFTANLVGAVVGVALLVAGKVGRRQPIPYGVFLATGTIGTLLFGPLIVPWLSLR